MFRLVPAGVRGPCLFLFALTLFGGCASTRAARDSGPALPVPPLTSDEDFGDARSEYSAFPLGSASREVWRKALLNYLLSRARELLAKHNDDAIDAFKNACSLYEPEELRDEDELPPELARLGEQLAARYSPRGAEEPVVLGLSV